MSSAPDLAAGVSRTGVRLGRGAAATAGEAGRRAGAGGASSGGTAGGAAGAERTCRVFETPAAPLSTRVPVGELLGSAGTLVDGTWYYRECRPVADDTFDLAGFWRYLAGAADTTAPAGGVATTPTAEALAQEAYDRVPLTTPQARTSPPADGEVLVGFPVWLWIDPAAWRSFTAEAAVPGLSVTVTATPRDLTWDMGDGTRLTCAGPGRPWVAGNGDQRSDCAHAYQFVSAHQADGRYPVAATLAWTVTWDASSGESGTLPDATRTATFPLEVSERQAVISHPGRP